jgi:hypothetical protein
MMYWFWYHSVLCHQSVYFSTHNSLLSLYLHLNHEKLNFLSFFSCFFFSCLLKQIFYVLKKLYKKRVDSEKGRREEKKKSQESQLMQIEVTISLNRSFSKYKKTWPKKTFASSFFTISLRLYHHEFLRVESFLCVLFVVSNLTTYNACSCSSIVWPL